MNIDADREQAIRLVELIGFNEAPRPLFCPICEEAFTPEVHHFADALTRVPICPRCAQQVVWCHERYEITPYYSPAWKGLLV